MVRFTMLLLAADVKQVLPDPHSRAAHPRFPAASLVLVKVVNGCYTGKHVFYSFSHFFSVPIRVLGKVHRTLSSVINQAFACSAVAVVGCNVFPHLARPTHIEAYFPFRPNDTRCNDCLWGKLLIRHAFFFFTKNKFD